MGFPYEEAIFQRLEATKQCGLVSEYLLSWSGRLNEWKPKVTVWPSDLSGDAVVKDYMVKLLKGFVPDGQIVVADN
jgi:hypothetical protein